MKLRSINLQKVIFTFVFTILTSFTPAFATTYYVDNNAGNDLNNGLSPSVPWQTLTKVNSFLFSPNDSILFIRNGVWRGQLIPQSGSAAGYITYSDYGIGEKPLFLGSINTSVFDEPIVNQSLAIFPNPATEILTIHLTDSYITELVQIFNSMGMLLKEFEIIELAKINICDLPSGIYFIHIKNQPRQRIKFIKQ